MKITILISLVIISVICYAYYIKKQFTYASGDINPYLILIHCGLKKVDNDVRLQGSPLIPRSLACKIRDYFSYEIGHRHIISEEEALSFGIDRVRLRRSATADMLRMRGFACEEIIRPREYRVLKEKERIYYLEANYNALLWLTRNFYHGEYTEYANEILNTNDSHNCEINEKVFDLSIF